MCNQTTAEFIPCSQHQPGQPPPPAASCACSGAGNHTGTALAQPPRPETCDHSVPFILSETSGQALGNLDLFGCWMPSQPRPLFWIECKKTKKGLFRPAVVVAETPLSQ